MLRVEEDGRWESYNTTDLHLSLTHWPQSIKEEGKTYSREPRGTGVQRLKLCTFQRFSSLCRHNGEQLALPHTLSHNYRKIYLHSERHLWIFPLLVLCIYKTWHMCPRDFCAHYNSAWMTTFHGLNSYSFLHTHSLCSEVPPSFYVGQKNVVKIWRHLHSKY